MNSREPVSRRGFFQRAVSATAAGGFNDRAPQLPTRAWIVVALNWEYNDEFSWQEGEQTLDKVYFDEAAANAECQKLCNTFFNEIFPSPNDFHPYWEQFDVDPETATWDDLRRAGFPNPYFTKEFVT